MMFVTQRPALAAIDRVRAPVLLLWGDQDPIIVREVIDHLLARRPDWELQAFEGAGHGLPLELPDAYADAVGRWLAADVSDPQPG